MKMTHLEDVYMHRREHLNLLLCTVELHLSGHLVIRIANCPDRLGPSGKFVENYTKLTCLEITGYRIK